MSRRQVVVVGPGEGDRVGNVEFLARSVDTPFFNLGVVTLAPGQGVPGHVHATEDDAWLVLDGVLTVTVGDDREVLRAGPGTFVLVPQGTYHALDNESGADVRFLNVHSPAGFDRRIGWRPRRPGLAATTMAVLAVLLLALGGPASAASMTTAKVRQVAAKVVQQRAPTLTVARAATAGTAGRAEVAGIAENAQLLDGREPRTYLDRVVVSDKGGSSTTSTTPVPVVEPLALVVPPGVEALRITGVAAFQGDPGKAQLYAVLDSEQCHAGRIVPGSMGASAPVHQSVTLERVVTVTPGAHLVTLCGQTVADSQVHSPVLVVQTVPDLQGEAPAY